MKYYGIKKSDIWAAIGSSLYAGLGTFLLVLLPQVESLETSDSILIGIVVMLLRIAVGIVDGK